MGKRGLNSGLAGGLLVLLELPTIIVAGFLGRVKLRWGGVVGLVSWREFAEHLVGGRLLQAAPLLHWRSGAMGKRGLNSGLAGGLRCGLALLSLQLAPLLRRLFGASWYYHRWDAGWCLGLLALQLAIFNVLAHRPLSFSIFQFAAVFPVTLSGVITEVGNRLR